MVSCCSTTTARFFDSDRVAQDIDIYDRLKQHYGKNAVRIAEGIDALAIPNSREDKMRLVDPQLGLSWNQMDQRNRQVFKKRLDAGQLFRNAGRTRGVPVTRVFVLVSSPGPLAQDNSELELIDV